MSIHLRSQFPRDCASGRHARPARARSRSGWRAMLLFQIVGTLGLTASPAVAQADAGVPKKAPVGVEPKAARFEGNRLAFELDAWPTETLKIFTYSLTGQLQLSGPVHFDFEAPVATLFPKKGDSKFVFGNPTLGAHWAGPVSASVSLALGVELAIPTFVTGADTSQDVFDEVILRSWAAQTRARVDGHRFLSDYLVLRPFLAAEVRLNTTVLYRGDVTASAFLGLGELARPATTHIVEHGSELEALSRGGVGGGLRFQGAFAFGDDDDKAQTALEPFFAYQKEKGFFTRLGLLVALDEPLGFGLDEGKLATLRLTLGSMW